jgi:hypothetical protein
MIYGNHEFHILIGIPDTFGYLAKKMFDMLPSFTRLDFITSNYKEGSIKVIT